MIDNPDPPEHENPFPEWPTIAHELGHWIIAWQVTVGSGIVFFPRHPSELAMAEYSRTDVSATDRVLIAVAGAVGQQELGRTGLCPTQPIPEEIFLAAPNAVAPQFDGDYRIAWEFAPQVPGIPRKVILGAIDRCRHMVAAVGGGRLIVALGQGIICWLEEDNRTRWKESLADQYYCSSVNFGEQRIHNLLREVAASDTSLAPGCEILITRIDQAIAERAARRPRR